MAATIDELKNIIIDLKIDLIKHEIPVGHCPYAYYNKQNSVGCDDISCQKCRRIFFENIRKDIEAEVETL